MKKKKCFKISKNHLHCTVQLYTVLVRIIRPLCKYRQLKVIQYSLHFFIICFLTDMVLWASV